MQQVHCLSEYSLSSPQMLSFMYAHLTFFHQGYDLFSELQPLMKQLGGQVQATIYTHTYTHVVSVCINTFDSHLNTKLQQQLCSALFSLALSLKSLLKQGNNVCLCNNAILLHYPEICYQIILHFWTIQKDVFLIYVVSTMASICFQKVFNSASTLSAKKLIGWLTQFHFFPFNFNLILCVKINAKLVQDNACNVIRTYNINSCNISKH